MMAPAPGLEAYILIHGRGRMPEVDMDTLKARRIAKHRLYTGEQIGQRQKECCRLSTVLATKLVILTAGLVAFRALAFLQLIGFLAFPRRQYLSVNQTHAVEDIPHMLFATPFAKTNTLDRKAPACRQTTEIRI